MSGIRWQQAQVPDRHVDWSNVRPGDGHVWLLFMVLWHSLYAIQPLEVRLLSLPLTSTLSVKWGDEVFILVHPILYQLASQHVQNVLANIVIWNYYRHHTLSVQLSNPTVLGGWWLCSHWGFHSITDASVLVPWLMVLQLESSVPICVFLWEASCLLSGASSFSSHWLCQWIHRLCLMV
jgi:hypothetical protein